jgi:glycosyltransferase involved in cell wall biosynthesis
MALSPDCKETSHRLVDSAPLVSVIIIFLDEERFIREAIESVFAQTYENWELLLVDDGSRDASTQIARRYAEQNPGKVRYLEHHGHQNRGMSASRNLGIRNARGEYIGFLDADDVWRPEKLAQQATILKLYPDAAMVCGPVEWWYSWTGKPEDIGRDYVVAVRVQPDTLFKPLQLLSRLLGNETVTTTSGLVRREAFETVGGFEENFHGLYEDQAFFAKLCSKAPVYIASQCWYRWRKHPDSCCSLAVSNGQYQSARSIFLSWLQNYLAEQGVTDREVSRVLQREMWQCRHPILNRLRANVRNPREQIKQGLKTIARRTLPTPFRRWLRAQLDGSEYSPGVGWVHFGSLRRITPISPSWGFDRGLPVDRYYIERFLSQHAWDIRGHVLEIGNSTYTSKFGGNRVTQSDVLHVVEGNPKATLVADLTRGEQIPGDAYDCIVFTQTLQFIYDVRATLKTLYRILKPGGILLATFPGISKISRYDMEHWGDYWRFTTLSSRKLFEEVFPSEHSTVKAFGNVCTALAFLHGLAAQELRQEELDHLDPDYEVLIAVRAMKPEP